MKANTLTVNHANIWEFKSKHQKSMLAYPDHHYILLNATNDTTGIPHFSQVKCKIFWILLSGFASNHTSILN